jgi:glycosyltransferase involved in cell wall biosynthesis
VNIPVILCSFNSCRTLGSTLNCLATSTLPKGVEWEVLVVDNNFTGRTREVIEEFCRRLPGRFRYLFGPQTGKSFALDCGYGEARG